MIFFSNFSIIAVGKILSNLKKCADCYHVLTHHYELVLVGFTCRWGLDLMWGWLPSSSLCFWHPSQSRKLSDNLVQNFLLPDQTPPILEAEMALRAEQLVNGERGRHTALTEKKTSSPRRIMSPDPKNPKTSSEVSRQEQTPSPRTETAKSPAPPTEKEVMVQQEVKPTKQEVKEPRQEPEGQITVTPIREKPKVPVVGRTSQIHCY